MFSFLKTKAKAQTHLCYLFSGVHLDVQMLLILASMATDGLKVILESGVLGGEKGQNVLCFIRFSSSSF